MIHHSGDVILGIEPDADATMLDGQPAEALQLFEDDMPEVLPCDLQGQPWHLQPGENPHEYGLFRVFCYLATNRQLARVAKKTGLSYAYIRETAKRNNWQDRAICYDTYWIQRQDEAKRRAQDLQAAKWAKRAQEQKEWEWDVSVKLRKQIQQMIEWPLFVETFERTEERLTNDGIVVHNIFRQEPADWDLADMARFMVIQSKFARLASGLDDKKLRSNVDVTKLSDAELEALTNET